MVSEQHTPMDTTTDEEEVISNAGDDQPDSAHDSDNASPQPVAAAPAAAPKATKPPTHTLYVRFYKRQSSAAEVQKLDAAIEKVRLPRQKNARHCLVDFRTAADMKLAAERLKSVVIDEHKLIVSVAHSGDTGIVQQKEQLQNERREQRAVLNRLIGCLEQVGNTDAKRAVTNGVYVRDLPRDIRRQEVEAVFPDALEVRILVHERQDRGAGASVLLPSPADALKARKTRVVIRELPYRPEFQRDGKHSVRLAKRLASRGQSMGPVRYFTRSGAGQRAEDEVKEEEDDDDDDADVVNEIMNVYN